MVEISNSDMCRILDCLDIAAEHYKSQKGLRNQTHAWAIGQLKDKINRKLRANERRVELAQTMPSAAEVQPKVKLKKQLSKSTKHDKE